MSLLNPNGGERRAVSMKLVLRTLSLLLFVSTSALSQNSNLADNQVVLLSSGDVPGEISSERLQSCLFQLAHEWKVPETSLPRIVVVHASTKAAKTAGVSNPVALRHNQPTAGDNSYYEVWLVGYATTEKYVSALEYVMEDYFHLNASESSRQEVTQRVARMLNATVSVSGRR